MLLVDFASFFFALDILLTSAYYFLPLGVSWRSQRTCTRYRPRCGAGLFFYFRLLLRSRFARRSGPQAAPPVAPPSAEDARLFLSSPFQKFRSSRSSSSYSFSWPGRFASRFAHEARPGPHTAIVFRAFSVQFPPRLFFFLPFFFAGQASPASSPAVRLLSCLFLFSFFPPARFIRPPLRCRPHPRSAR